MRKSIFYSLCPTSALRAILNSGLTDCKLDLRASKTSELSIKCQKNWVTVGKFWYVFIPTILDHSVILIWQSKALYIHRARRF